MVRDIDDLTEEEFIEAAHRAMPRFLEAQRLAAGLYATQFGIDVDHSVVDANPESEPTPKTE